MTISRSVTNPATGVTATVWKIVDYRVSPLKKFISIDLGGFINEEIANQSDGRPVGVETFNYQNDDFVNFPSENELYLMIDKTLNAEAQTSE